MINKKARYYSMSVAQQPYNPRSILITNEHSLPVIDDLSQAKNTHKHQPRTESGPNIEESILESNTEQEYTDKDAFFDDLEQDLEDVEAETSNIWWGWKIGSIIFVCIAAIYLMVWISWVVHIRKRGHF